MVNMDTKSPLGELIESARKLAGYSQQDVADRATARGFGMSKQNVGRLVNQPLVTVNATIIKGIAAALGLSESRVAAEALASMGVDLGKSGTPLQEAILDAVEIDERTKRSLLAILGIEQKAGNDSGTSAQKRNDEDGDGGTGGSVTELNPKKPTPAAPAKRAARKTTDPRKK